MTTLFTNGNLVDVIGQTVLTGGSILVENGMIKEVGTSIAAPDGAKVVDLGGRTVLPGLFNCHVHMCSDAGDHYGSQHPAAILQIGRAHV